MHYNVDYKGLSSTEASDKALADIREYLGEAKFNEITDEFRKGKLTLEQFRLYASFAGIQGYPIPAWYNYTYSK